MHRATGTTSNTGLKVYKKWQYQKLHRHKNKSSPAIPETAGNVQLVVSVRTAAKKIIKADSQKDGIEANYLQGSFFHP